MHKEWFQFVFFAYLGNRRWCFFSPLDNIFEAMVSVSAGLLIVCYDTWFSCGKNMSNWHECCTFHRIHTQFTQICCSSNNDYKTFLEENRNAEKIVKNEHWNCNFNTYMEIAKCMQKRSKRKYKAKINTNELSRFRIALPLVRATKSYLLNWSIKNSWWIYIFKEKKIKLLMRNIGAARVAQMYSSSIRFKLDS